MGLKKRLTAVGIIAIAAALTFGIAKSGRQMTEKQDNTVFTGGKETLYLWYTDEALTSYLSSAAVTYNESHDVRIVPVLESGLEYLEKINRLLKPGGKILIAIENRLGLKYFAGRREDHVGREFVGIEGYPGIDFVETFSKLELEQMLQELM